VIVHAVKYLKSVTPQRKKGVLKMTKRNTAFEREYTAIYKKVVIKDKF